MQNHKTVSIQSKTKNNIHLKEIVFQSIVRSFNFDVLVKLSAVTVGVQIKKKNVFDFGKKLFRRRLHVNVCTNIWKLICVHIL